MRTNQITSTVQSGPGPIAKMMTWFKQSSTDCEPSRFGTPCADSVMLVATTTSSSSKNTKRSLKAIDKLTHHNLSPDTAMNDSYGMERLYGEYVEREPNKSLFVNNPVLSGERRCRIINWLIQVCLLYVCFLYTLIGPLYNHTIQDLHSLQHAL